MAADVYVIPLWRFFAGEFVPPLARAFGSVARVEIATRRIVEVTDKAPRAGFLQRRRAKRAAASVMRAINAHEPGAGRWRDEGECLYSEQAHVMEALGPYAVWLDYSDVMTSFEPPLPDRCWGSHQIFDVHQKEKRNLRFHHTHLLRCGHLGVPVDFPQPVWFEKKKIANLEFHRFACSTPRALHELDRMNEELRVPSPFVWEEHKSDPLVNVYPGWIQLREIVALSVQHGLPIVWDY